MPLGLSQREFNTFRAPEAHSGQQAVYLFLFSHKIHSLGTRWLAFRLFSTDGFFGHPRVKVRKFLICSEVGFLPTTINPVLQATHRFKRRLEGVFCISPTRKHPLDLHRHHPSSPKAKKVSRFFLPGTPYTIPFITNSSNNEGVISSKLPQAAEGFQNPHPRRKPARLIFRPFFLEFIFHPSSPE